MKQRKAPRPNPYAKRCVSGCTRPALPDKGLCWWCDQHAQAQEKQAQAQAQEVE